MNGKVLIDYCSPTLAGLKVGNIFSYAFNNDRDMYRFLAYWNKMLNPKGIFITYLNKINDEKINVYVYRKAKLENVLADNDIRDFLFDCGYSDFGLAYVIARLRERMSSNAFPHEIGVILGYPLDDIKGFIANCGKNYKCVGCWKVYHNELNAIEIFESFNRCKKVYKKNYGRGVDLARLAVVI